MAVSLTISVLRYVFAGQPEVEVGHVIGEGVEGHVLAHTPEDGIETVALYEGEMTEFVGETGKWTDVIVAAGIEIVDVGGQYHQGGAQLVGARGPVGM